ncbi:MAG TPA: DUF2017 domain-containing protein [Propionibacteriaceae bacterium]|nr:DUF2017 domain-containing protein [Propionibacteriaceae bacterium]
MRSEFVRDGEGGIMWYCLPFEVGLLESMVTQLVELVDAPPWSEDPLERWVNEREAPPLDREDPALSRLFPDASSNPDEASEFRRLMEAELRSQKSADAEVVLAALEPARGSADPEVAIPVTEQQAWLRTLNAVRLVLGARLGIEDEEDAELVDGLDAEDERAPVADVYHWVGYVQSLLLDAITG